jgi:hypothetical protein
MEKPMSEDAAPQCAYCSQYGHPEEDCKDKRSDRAFSRGCAVAALVCLAPFAVAGVLVGWAWTAFKAGLSFATGRGWATAWETFFPRPQNSPEVQEDAREPR